MRVSSDLVTNQCTILKTRRNGEKLTQVIHTIKTWTLSLSKWLLFARQLTQRKCSLCSQGRLNFTLGLRSIFFWLILIITHKHTQKQRKLKFKPRIKRKLIIIHFGTLARHRLSVARLFIQWRAYLRKSFDALKCLLMHQPMIVTNQTGEHACNVAQNCGLRKFHISTKRIFCNKDVNGSQRSHLQEKRIHHLFLYL